jgi:hypothetical protein
MNKGLIIAAVLALAPTFAAAESFKDAFEMNRAMYGKNHTFTWQGKQYTTMHEEEAEAAVKATKANAEALLAKAKAKNAEVAKLGYEWKLTRGILTNAQTAIDKGEYRKALNLAAQAKYLARMGIQQYLCAQANWYLAVPQ